MIHTLTDLVLNKNVKSLHSILLLEELIVIARAHVSRCYTIVEISMILNNDTYS